MKHKKSSASTPISYETAFYITGWCLIGILCLSILIYRLIPPANRPILPICTLYRLTGIYCPGCGGTRSTIYLLTGHPIRSFIYHPVVFYAGAVGGWFMLSQTIERISRHRFKIGLKYRDSYLWIALILAIVNFILKNVFLFAFDIDLLRI